MSLDKLGNSTLQQQGIGSSEKVHDQKTHQLLDDIRTELRIIRMAMCEMTGLDIQPRDIEEDV